MRLQIVDLAYLRYAQRHSDFEVHGKSDAHPVDGPDWASYPMFFRYPKLYTAR